MGRFFSFFHFVINTGQCNYIAKDFRIVEEKTEICFYNLYDYIAIHTINDSSFNNRTYITKIATFHDGLCYSLNIYTNITYIDI